MPGLIDFSGCDPCSLRKTWDSLWTPKMPICYPEEESEYRVLVVGEAPGEAEDNEGVPFVGKAGQFLRQYIPKEWEKKLYWTNSVRCRPTDGNKNRAPSPQEISCCSVFLKEDLLAIKPHAILCIGDIALKRFWPTGWVTGIRGIPFPIQVGDKTAWGYSTFHSSYIMRQNREDFNTGEITNSYAPVFRNDIKNFFDLVPYFAANPPKIYSPPKDVVYPKTEQEVISLFERLKKPYCVDIETHKLKPYMRDARIATAGFSDGDLTFAFPVCWRGRQNSWGFEAFKKVMLKKKRWIASHASFEYAWIWDCTGSWDHDFEDIEVLARLIHKKAGVGSLDDTSRIYLGVDIKTLTKLDKNRLLDYSLEEVLEYNAYDAWAEMLIWNILVEKATDNDLENYVKIIDTIKSTVAMELNGLSVDQEESAKLQKEFVVKLHDIGKEAKKVKEVIDFEKRELKLFSLSSDETVGWVLAKYCGFDLPKTPSGQQYSTDQEFLEKLAGQHPLIDLRLDYKEVQKLLSTYITPILSGDLLGIDNLLHPSYTVVHTRTYRLSSEDPNIQNWPKRAHKELRKQIVAPPGYILVAFDYAQLEARVIAMFTRDPGLRKAFITDEDIHWKWLYRIIDLYPQYMDRLAKISGETEEKKVLNAGRTIIKTDFVFASFYGSIARSIAKRTDLPLEIAEQVLAEFWECVSPDTRVLTTDLRWVRAEDVSIGQELVGFDENLNPSTSRKGGQRKFRSTKVLETRRLVKKCVKVTTTSGSYICSEDHLWLAKNSKQGDLRWIQAKDLHIKKGNYIGERGKVVIVRLCHPWEEDKSYEAGYLSGILDGEGFLSKRAVAFSQNEGIVLEKSKTILQERGHLFTEGEVAPYIDKNGKKSKHKHKIISIRGGRAAILRLLGSIRPPRLLSKSKTVWEETMLYSGKNSQDLVDEVLSIEEVGEKEVIAIHTDTHTFVAEGLLSHNCYKEAKPWVLSQFREYKEIGSVSSITGRVRNEVLPGNEPANSPVQGTAAEIVLEAQNALFFQAVKKDKYLLPRINIHDDLIFCCPDSNDLEQYIITIAKEIVKPRFPWVTVPLASECRIGYDWYSLEAVKTFSGPYFE